MHSRSKLVSLVVLAALLVLLVAPVASADYTPALFAVNQDVVDGIVNVTRVVSNGPGWVVVHTDGGGMSGPVLGFTAVPDGVSANVKVQVPPADVTPVLYIQLNQDAGQIGTFEYPGIDGPVLKNGEPIEISIEVPVVGSSLATVAADNGLNQFMDAVTAAGLDSELAKGGPYTLFAPSDDAFATIPADEWAAIEADPEQLSAFVQNHMVDGIVATSAITELVVLTSLAGNELDVQPNGSQYIVNGAIIEEPDIEAYNGLIHVIDSLLMPPTPVTEAAPVSETAATTETAAITESVAVTGADAAKGTAVVTSSVETTAGAAAAVAAVPAAPTEAPTATPTKAPTATPTEAPTATPTKEPTATPTEAPTATPTEAPTATPTKAPTATPTKAPTATPTKAPTATPTKAPTATPTEAPTATPTEAPTVAPTEAPTEETTGVATVETKTAESASTAESTAGVETAPVAGAPSTGTDKSVSGDLIETLQAAATYPTFVSAIQSAGLTGILEGDGPYTAFIPSEEAFAALPAGTLEALNAEPLSDLKAAVLNHIVKGKLSSDQITDGMTVDSLAGKPLTFAVAADGSIQVNGANVIVKDILASNGVAHIIDNVFLGDVTVSAPVTPTEALTETVEAAPAEAVTETVEAAPAEAMTETVEAAPAEAMTETVEAAPAEAMTETVEAAPAEAMTETVEAAPAEAMTETVEAVPAEAMTETVEAAPAEAVTETVEAAPAEAMTETVEAAPAEAMTETVEAAPAEAMTETVEAAPAEAMTETVEAVPAEAMTETVEAAPAEAVTETVEAAPAESSEAPETMPATGAASSALPSLIVTLIVLAGLVCLGYATRRRTAQ